MLRELKLNSIAKLWTIGNDTDWIKRTMTKKRDRFWEYVEDLKGRFKCNFCQKEFAGGISRIKSHLSGKKGRDIEICLKVPDNVQVEACQAIGSPYKKAKNIAVSISGVGGGINSTSTTSMNDKDAVDKRFIKFILLNNISDDVIQSQAFIDFVKGVSQFGPNYELPNLVHQAKLVVDYDREILRYVRNAKESWVVTGCTLLVDIENGDEHSYINVFSYCPKGVVFLKSSVTSRDGMTWIYLKDIVSSTIDEIGVDKVLQLIVDNNEGFELTAYMLLEYSQVYITRCAIHGIQSLLMDLFSKVDWFRRITMAGKMILSYIHKRSINLSFQIQKHTKYKKFEHPCLARFASNFLLLHSILEFETELKDLQLLDASLDWKSLDFNMQELAKWVANVIESTPFWTLVKEVLHIVDILFQVLRLVSGDAPTSGYLCEAMKKASTEIRQCCNEDQAKYKLILELFEERKMNDIIHPIHAAAAFLNPDNMCNNENFVEDLEMKEGISFIEDNLVAASERQAFAEQVQLYRMKAPNVFTTTALKMSKTSHPRLWWHYCGEHLPVLKKYAIRILSQPCSSSCKIKRLMPKTDDDYTRMNILMMEKFSVTKAQDLEAIDLGKLIGLPEYVDHQDLDDFPHLESISEIMENDTFDDPLRLWLQNEVDFINWNITPEHVF